MSASRREECGAPSFLWPDVNHLNFGTHKCFVVCLFASYQGYKKKEH